MTTADTPDGVLCIAAHPDDEVLGCGGVLALHARNGEPVTIVIVCEGESLRYGPNGVGQSSHILRAAERLGGASVRHLRFPDQALDTIRLTELIAPLEEIVRQQRPRVVYCQYGGDINRDHQILFQAILVATRPTETCIDSVYAFDTASSTEWAYPRSFIPDTWMDISSTLDAKLAAMACYESELRPYPHPRSLKALEYRARAFGNQFCVEAAEVFMTVRRVNHPYDEIEVNDYELSRLQQSLRLVLHVHSPEAHWPPIPTIFQLLTRRWRRPGELCLAVGRCSVKVPKETADEAWMGWFSCRGHPCPSRRPGAGLPRRGGFHLETGSGRQEKWGRGLHAPMPGVRHSRL